MSVDIVVSFDTTGSMASAIHEVRLRVREMVSKLFSAIPDLRMGLIAHGDYCDGRDGMTILDLTNEQSALERFILTNQSTSGGDNDEFYEVVMQEARQLAWRPESKRIFVLIGDANPHEVGYRYDHNTFNVSWSDEALALAGLRIPIYAVQALGRSSSTRFYRQIAEMTNGRHLNLNQFTDMVESILAIGYHGAGKLDEYRQELEDNFKMNRSLANLMFDLDHSVRVENSGFVRKDKSGLIPVLPSRFQVLNVGRETTIKEFVEALGMVFRKGRGFYEFQKHELVQENKEVILQNRLTGDMFTGGEAREFIGLPYGTRGKISPKKFDEYRVFIQSTSSTRKLIPGYKFLYEID